VRESLDSRCILLSHARGVSLLWHEASDPLCRKSSHFRSSARPHSAFCLYFLYDRSLHQLLFTAAWETIHGAVGESLGEALMPAAVFALHTASDTLGWNPHIHGMVPDGSDGTRINGFPFHIRKAMDKSEAIWLHSGV